MDPRDVAKLRWRIQFESLYDPALEAVAHQSTDHLKPKDRIAVVKGREAAQALLKTLFPEDD